jgi:hypothetical protein
MTKRAAPSDLAALDNEVRDEDNQGGRKQGSSDEEGDDDVQIRQRTIVRVKRHNQQDGSVSVD